MSSPTALLVTYVLWKGGRIVICGRSVRFHGKSRPRARTQKASPLGGEEEEEEEVYNYKANLNHGISGAGVKQADHTRQSAVRVGRRRLCQNRKHRLAGIALHPSSVESVKVGDARERPVRQIVEQLWLVFTAVHECWRVLGQVERLKDELGIFQPPDWEAKIDIAGRHF